MDTKTDAFLLSIGMHPDLTDAVAQTGEFLRQMELGLKSDASCFDMTPTYLSTEGHLPLGERVLVLDAGGTTLRTAFVTFWGGAIPRIEDLRLQPVPGSSGPLTKEEYLRAMTEALRPYLGEDVTVAYCFSHAVRMLKNGDAELIEFSKGIRVEGSRGMHVLGELEDAIRRSGIPGRRKWVFLNDSVAAACGGLHKCGKEYSGVIGFILGTGTNTCYAEKVSAVTRYDLSGFSGRMLLNMEAAAYNRFPFGAADRLLHENDLQPGQHPYEKAVSGAYLGKLIYYTACLAVKADLFSPAFAEALAAAAPFTTVEADSFVREPAGNNRMAGFCANETDRERLLALTTRLYERAARFAAVNLTAVLLQSGLGTDEKRPAFICCEGSTFWRSALYLPSVTREMEQLAGRHFGLHYCLSAVPQANLTGSAAAALLN